LTACRFVELEKELPANLTFNNVTVLVLNDCAMPWSQIEKLKKSFPNLQELHLGKNNLRTIDATDEFVTGFDQLTTLNISDNAFENWSEITKLGKLPK
jgi:Leucine-rich repeat (LRR) protein